MEIKLIKKSDSPVGVDALFSLSYSAAAGSTLPKSDKRKLLFSLYCMRSIFDNNDLLDPPALLVQHGCAFLFSVEQHPDFDKNKDFFVGALQQKDAVSVAGMGVIISYNGEKKLKFDCGSPLFKSFAANGHIVDDNAAYPDKYLLLEAVDVLLGVNSAGAELKALWLILFPFLLGRAPDNGDYIPSIAEKLNTEEVFRAAAENEYAALVPPDPGENFANDRFFATWFEDFAAWRTKNLSPRTSRLYSQPPFAGDGTQGNSLDSQRSNRQDGTCDPQGGSQPSFNGKNCFDSADTPLNQDDSASFSDNDIQEAIKIVEDAERLLQINPQDEEILLLLLASRAHLPPHLRTTKMLSDSVTLISKYLPTSKNAAPLAYYMGLNLLGLHQIEKATKAFRLCLKIKPDFMPAIDMLAALDKNDD